MFDMKFGASNNGAYIFLLVLLTLKLSRKKNGISMKYFHHSSPCYRRATASSLYWCNGYIYHKDIN